MIASNIHNFGRFLIDSRSRWSCQKSVQIDRKRRVMYQACIKLNTYDILTSVIKRMSPIDPYCKLICTEKCICLLNSSTSAFESRIHTHSKLTRRFISATRREWSIRYDVVIVLQPSAAVWLLYWSVNCIVIQTEEWNGRVCVCFMHSQVSNNIRNSQGNVKVR